MAENKSMYASVGNEKLASIENSHMDGKAQKGEKRSAYFKFSKSGTVQSLSEELLIGEQYFKKLNRIDSSGFWESQAIVDEPNTKNEIYKIVYPDNCLCYLDIEVSPSIQTRGTGFFISPQCILTAGQNIFNPKSKAWVQRVKVVPSAMMNLEPFGYAYADRFRSLSGWLTGQQSGFNLGAVILSDVTLYQKVNASFGYKAFNRESKAEIAGYAVDGDLAISKRTSALSQNSPITVAIGLDAAELSSGSPILSFGTDTGQVIGIYTNEANSPYGVTIDQEILNRLSEWSQLK